MNKPVELIIVACECGDWEGIYVNGELWYDGHNIYNHAWIRLIETFKSFSDEIKSFEVSEEYMSVRGSFPPNFEEIPQNFIKNRKN